MKQSNKKLLKRIEQLEKEKQEHSVMTESLKAVALFGTIYAIGGGFNK